MLLLFGPFDVCGYFRGIVGKETFVMVSGCISRFLFLEKDYIWGRRE